MNIVNWNTLTLEQKEKQLARPVLTQTGTLRERTQTIIDSVRQQGDTALRDFSLEFDGVTLTEFQTSTAAFQQAIEAITPAAREAIEHAADNIRTFHQRQVLKPLQVETQPGVMCEKITRPIQRVGLYVPGGSAPLVSTVLMLGIPSQLAGNPQRILCSPPDIKGNINPHILVAAQLCGIERVFKLGGAQAIAAMAYGTESVPKVDKIFGPGNAWVTQAKQCVAQTSAGAALDMPAGPSEVVVIADAQANPDFIAADLLSQLEHGIDSQALCFVTDETLAQRIKQKLMAFLPGLDRQAIIKQALIHSAIIVVDSVHEAIELVNDYAPEHLILQMQTPQQWLPDITCAGSIFLGPWAAEAVGDYASGTNHVLPTYGYAKQYSGLSVTDFCVQMTVQSITESGLKALAPTVMTLAELEGLSAHRLAIQVRMEKNNV